MAAYGGIPSGYTNYLNDFQSLLSQYTPQMSYTPMSESEIRSKLEAALRPGVDLAIGNRQKQTLTNKANIDVDAASRGMGSSTWVTDVKDRAQDAEASDITSLEAQYGATIAQQLMQALQNERANQFAADQFNASSRANALQSAMGLAGDFYGQSLQTGKSANRGGPKTDTDFGAFLDALGGSTPTGGNKSSTGGTTVKRPAATTANLNKISQIRTDFRMSPADRRRKIAEIIQGR